ncbi:MAG: phosphoribosylaminoimidazolesuccinocarboxamide synthase [Lachnospiraceae bacterium]|nr:phosphoribosylaminoimidazolesuccinocarboxamide synthase [Lachnospiraceae bacterium]
MQEYKPVKSGKVREIYEADENLIMVATDRISAFDVILKNKIPGKGIVLTRISEFWFDFTKDILPNHLVSSDVNDMPEFFRTKEFEGRSMLVKKLRMIPIECIVRGYITGSGWESYQKDGRICGHTLPEGLKNCDKLAEPVYTPSTKADIGDHDENINFEKSASLLNEEFPGKGKAYAEKIRDYSLALYKKCAEYALKRGIILADTKFEFGLDEDDNIVLADEVLTPDSSRFWPVEGYEAGRPQPSFDKQFVRDYLKANPGCDYTLPQDVIDKTIEKYKEAYRMLSGKEIGF